MGEIKKIILFLTIIFGVTYSNSISFTSSTSNSNSSAQNLWYETPITYFDNYLAYSLKGKNFVFNEFIRFQTTQTSILFASIFINVIFLCLSLYLYSLLNAKSEGRNNYAAFPSKLIERVLAVNSIFDNLEYPKEIIQDVPGPTSRLFSTLNFSNDTKIILNGKVGIQNIILTLDTGASSNIVGYSTFLGWKRSGSIKEQQSEFSNVTILDASNRAMKEMTPPVLVDLQIGSFTFPTVFKVLENISVNLLGAQFMALHKLNLIYDRDSSIPHLEIGTKDFTLGRIETQMPQGNTAIALYTQDISPGFNKIKFSVLAPHLSMVTVELIEKVSLLRIFEHLVQSKHGVIEIEIWNIGDQPIASSPRIGFIKYEVQQNSFVADLSQICSTNEVGIPEKEPISFEELNETINSDLIQKAELDNDEKLLESENLDARPISPIEFADESLIEPKGLDVDLNRLLEADKNSWKTDIRKSNFPKEWQEKFIERLEVTCPQAFSSHALDPGKLDKDIMFVEDIGLEPGVNVRCKPIKLDFIRREQVREIIDKLIKHGLVKRGMSDNYSPVFVVAKAQGTLRLVTGYSRLNAKAKKEFYQIPNLKDQIRKISESNEGKNHIFTQLDLSNAYSAIQLGEKAQRQTALCTEEELLVPLRLMFGLQCAPAIFNLALSRVIEKIEGGRDWIFIYFDDITITSPKDYQLHFDRVCRVFEGLGKYGFKCQALKCNFFAQEVDVYGARISRFGVMPQTKHIKTVEQLVPPTDVTEVQKIQGILVWHSHLIPMFSYHMAPINELTRKGVEFVWGPRQQNALNHFKGTIKSFLMTHFPEYNREVYLATDASKNCIAGILYMVKSFKNDPKILAENLVVQDCTKEIEREFPVLPKSGKNCPKAYKLLGGEEVNLVKTYTLDSKLSYDSEKSDLVHVCQPIGYFSRSLTRAQSKYTALEQEALALVEAVVYFKEILWGFKERYLISDSQPCLYMAKKAVDNDNKISRWLIKLRQVNIELIIVHCQGKLNKIADLLSRCIYLGMAAETPTDGHIKINKKLPIIVKSPFKPGQVIEFEDIIRVVHENPSIVYNLSPGEEGFDDCTKNISNTSTMEVETLGYLGKVTAKLQRDLELSNIIEKQKLDKDCLEKIENIQKWKNFYVFQGVLYKKRLATDSENKQGLIVVPKALLMTLIICYHVNNHAGAVSLYHQIRRNYYYLDLYQSINQFVKTCYLCMVFKSHRNRQPLGLKPYYPQKKCATWSIDVLEGFKKSRKGYIKVLSCIEHYSQFCVIAPLRSADSEEIGDIILNRIFSIFPLPRVIISDNAKNLLRSKNLQKTCLYFGVGIHCLSGYNSASNGLVENLNKKVADLLRILIESLKKPWPDLLPVAMIALNSKPVKSIGYYSPYEVMFGLSNNFTRRLSEKEKEYIGYPDLLRKNKIEKTKFDKIAEKWNDQRNKENAKKVKVKGIRYNKGDLVFVKNKTPGVATKLRPIYFRVPLVVIADFGSACLLKDFQQRVRQHHKNFVFPCSTLDTQLYSYIPDYVKEKIGLCYTYEDLVKFFNDKETIPKIFINTDKDPITAPLTFEEIITKEEASDPVDLEREAEFDDLDLVDGEDYKLNVGFIDSDDSDNENGETAVKRATRRAELDQKIDGDILPPNAAFNPVQEAIKAEAFDIPVENNSENIASNLPTLSDSNVQSTPVTRSSARKVSFKDTQDEKTVEKASGKTPKSKFSKFKERVSYSLRPRKNVKYSK